MGGKQCIKVWTITYKEISLLPTALKIFKRSSLQRLQILSVLGDSAYIFLRSSLQLFSEVFVFEKRLPDSMIRGVAIWSTINFKTLYLKN